MITKEFCKKMLNLINNMKNEKLKGRMLNIGDYITEIRSKKKMKSLINLSKSLEMMKIINLETS